MSPVVQYHWKYLHQKPGSNRMDQVRWIWMDLTLYPAGSGPDRPNPLDTRPDPVHHYQSLISNHLCCCRKDCTVIPIIHFVHQIFTFFFHILYFFFTDKVWQYCKPITLKLHTFTKYFITKTKLNITRLISNYLMPNKSYMIQYEIFMMQSKAKI